MLRLIPCETACGWHTVTPPILASRAFHISEDVFAGYNHTLRGARTKFVEYISVGKGRDMGFDSINSFESKVQTLGRVTRWRGADKLQTAGMILLELDGPSTLPCLQQRYTPHHATACTHRLVHPESTSACAYVRCQAMQKLGHEHRRWLAATASSACRGTCTASEPSLTSFASWPGALLPQQPAVTCFAGMPALFPEGVTMYRVAADCTLRWSDVACDIGGNGCIWSCSS